MTAEKPRVLCVDDEPGVLAGIRLTLRKRFTVELAESGPVALSKLASSPNYAVVLSDMRMPGMNGAEFLKAVKEHYPDCVRMLLTGQTDLDAAVMAINEGQIFRFLTKPCAPDLLIAAFTAANAQHQLLSAEKELLERTLNGSVQTLIEVLSLTQPAAFGRAARIKRLCQSVASMLKTPQTWSLEVAATLVQIGIVTLSDELVNRWFHGGTLSEAERGEVDAVPAASVRLLSAIPRLDPVLEIIEQSAEGHEQRTSLSARILYCVRSLDALELQGLSPFAALEQLRSSGSQDCGAVLEALDAVLVAEQPERRIVEIELKALEPEMTLIDNVYMVGGALLVAKGTVVTPVLIQRMRNRGKQVVQPLKVALA